MATKRQRSNNREDIAAVSDDELEISDIIEFIGNERIAINRKLNEITDNFQEDDGEDDEDLIEFGNDLFSFIEELTYKLNAFDIKSQKSTADENDEKSSETQQKKFTDAEIIQRQRHLCLTIGMYPGDNDNKCKEHYDHRGGTISVYKEAGRINKKYKGQPFFLIVVKNKSLRERLIINGSIRDRLLSQFNLYDNSLGTENDKPGYDIVYDSQASSAEFYVPYSDVTLK